VNALRVVSYTPGPVARGHYRCLRNYLLDYYPFSFEIQRSTQ